MALKASCWVGRCSQAKWRSGAHTQCGKRCSRWKDLTTARAEKTKERSHWCMIWLTLSSAPVFVDLGDAFQNSQDSSASAMRVLRRVQFERRVAEPLQTITAILFGSKWSWSCNQRGNIGSVLEDGPKQLGAENGRRKKCDVRFSFTMKNSVCQKNSMRIGVRKLLRRGLVPARVLGGRAVGIAPTERLKLARQMEAAAGRKDWVLAVTLWS